MVERPLSRHILPLVALKDSSVRCDLCTVLWRLLVRRLSTSSSQDIQLYRKGSRIVYQFEGETRRALSVCQMPRELLKPEHAALTTAMN